MPQPTKGVPRTKPGAASRSFEQLYAKRLLTLPRNQIYEAQHERLEDLVEMVGGQDATLLIPDLQRPYVWSPDRVPLLVDSLMRGWPFGSLLFWKVGRSHSNSIPSRPFWIQVDRTEAERGAAAHKQVLGTSYRMVLDGQQRLQSLVLAFGPEAAGFKLPDVEWADALPKDVARGRSWKLWSRAQLYLHLPSFEAAMLRVGNQPELLDFRDGRILQWAVDSETEGVAIGKRPHNYVQPLPLAFRAPTDFLRLTRLWKLAAHRQHEHQERLIDKVLPELGLSPTRAVELGILLARITPILSEVRQTEVPYLQLRPLAEDESIGEYNRAVVSIFTRLNTAGQTLTDEEITFAWIKNNWRADATGGKGADVCFEELRAALKSEGLPLKMNELVEGVAVVWAVLCNKGELLTAEHLLDGNYVGRLANDIHPRWEQISTAFIEAARSLATREFERFQHFDSLNALFVLVAAQAVAREWRRVHKLQTTAAADFEAQLSKVWPALSERWLVLTAWAGRNSSRDFARFVQELSGDWAQLLATPGLQVEVRQRLAARFDAWTRDMEADAVKHIDGLAAASRNEVQKYFVPLWIWHRLDASRWAASSVQLPRTAKGREKRAALRIDVDHVVAFKQWRDKLGDAAVEEEESVNALGNCILLEKNFNIAKEARPLKQFLEELPTFLRGKLEISTWLSTMALDDTMADATSVEVPPLRAAVEARGKQMKKELTDYIRGEVHVAAPAIVVAGRWTTTATEESGQVQWLLELAQSGVEVEGTYASPTTGKKVGQVRGRLDGNRFVGLFKEGKLQGAVSFTFTGEGSLFTGDWESNDGSKYPWTGTRS